MKLDFILTTNERRCAPVSTRSVTLFLRHVDPLVYRLSEAGYMRLIIEIAKPQTDLTHLFELKEKAFINGLMSCRYMVFRCVLTLHRVASPKNA